MENKQTYHQTKDKWKGVALLLIALSVILTVATVVFAINSVQTDEDSNTSAKLDDADVNSNDTSMEFDDTSEASEYLVVKEWGLKLNVEVFSALDYSISGERLDFKGNLSVIPGWELEGGFFFESAKDEILYLVRRPQNDDPFKECLGSCPVLITTVNNYNIYFSHRQMYYHESLVEENYAGVAFYLLARMVMEAEAI